ncbi:MAG: PP2C family protein-serine/threonine phosphatase [Thermoanaerobaculia bacterium]
MAGLSSWRRLAEETVRSLETRSVTRLYTDEWPEARRQLVERYSDEIAREPRRVRRSLRGASAILLGLAERLVPQRRILFLLALLLGLLGFLGLLSNIDVNRRTVVVVFAIFFCTATMVFLLGLELIDKLRYRDELELARDLQASLLPKELPRVPGYDLDAYNRIANTVGGDLYAFAHLPDGRLAVLFGDAAGHGMAAGLVMAVAHAAFQTHLEIDPTAQGMVEALNRILCRTGGSRSFFAGAYLLIEPDGRFEAVVAGNPPILLITPSGEVRTRIGAGAYPLGIKTNAHWRTEAARLGERETLLLYSDGLAEARDADGRELGYGRVDEVAGKCGGRPARELVASLIAEWRNHSGDRIPEDDISIAAIHRL